MSDYPIHHFATVDSTNTIAVRMATEDNAQHGTVIQADCQTGGRGRGGREFYSPVGGLYFSLIVRPRLAIAELPLITLAAGVGICNGIQKITDVQPLLKWPNDLYFDERKLAGILTESGAIRNGTPPEFIVIGVGVNLTTEPEQFPASLRNTVISLSQCTGVDVFFDKNLLLPVLVSEILASILELGNNKEELMTHWRTRDYLQGRPLNYVTDKIIPATGVGLANDGQYVIVDQQDIEHYILAGDLNPISL